MILKSLTKDSIVYGGADLVGKIISFFTFPIVASILSPKDYGALELLLTVTGLLGLVMNAGMNNSVQRYYWESDSNTENIKISVVTSGFVILSVLGVGVILLSSIVIPLFLYFFSETDIGLTKVGIWSAVTLMVFTQLFQYNLDITRLHFAKWKFFLLSIVIRTLSVFAGLIAVVKFKLGIEGLLIAQLIVLVLAVPWSVFLVKADFNISSLSLEWIKKLLKFGVPFISAGLAFWLFGSMDRWMLSFLSTVDEVGIYSVSFRFASLVMFVSSAFGQAWSPIAFKVRSDYPDLYKKLFGDVLLMLIVVMLVICSFLALFAGELVGAFMPSIYLPSVLPFVILILGISFQSTQQVTAIGISIEKKTYLFSRLSWVSACVNFILNFLLIPIFGAVGAALATLFSYLVLTLTYFFFSQRLHPMRVSYIKLIVICLLGLAVFIFGLNFISYTPKLNLMIWKIAVYGFFVFTCWKVVSSLKLTELTKI